jgi:hypothetical protein
VNDEKALLILDTAKKMDLSSGFSFVTRRVKSDKLVWQVSLVQDKGDRNGPFIFCQGEGDSTDQALDGLVTQLQAALSKLHAQTIENAKKTATQFEERTQALQDALLSLSVSNGQGPETDT